VNVQFAGSQYGVNLFARWRYGSGVWEF